MSSVEYSILFVAAGKRLDNLLSTAQNNLSISPALWIQTPGPISKEEDGFSLAALLAPFPSLWLALGSHRLPQLCLLATAIGERLVFQRANFPAWRSFAQPARPPASRRIFVVWPPLDSAQMERRFSYSA